MAAGIIAGAILPGNRIHIWLPLLLIIILSISLAASRNMINSARHSLLTLLFISAAAFSLYRLRMARTGAVDPPSTIYVVRADDYPEIREKSVRLPVTLISTYSPTSASSQASSHPPTSTSSQDPSQNPSHIPTSRSSQALSHPPTSASSKFQLKTSSQNKKIMLYFSDSLTTGEIKPGTHFSLFLNPLHFTDPDPSDNFDYPLYMKRKGFLFYAFVYETPELLPGPPGIKNRSLLIRDKIAAVMAKRIDNRDALALTAALTLGHRELLSEDITENFRRSGITHILAVSGLHVGMFSLLVLGLLSFLKGRLSFIPPLAAIIAIWCFALVTGLGPSVTRASLMFTFLHAGLLMRRGVNSINSLLASAFVLLIINPALLFDTGFQLSYSAVLFILLFYRDLHSLIPVKNKLLNKLWSMMAVTLLAQAGTLPFIIYYFNSVPLLSVITNIIAVPAAFLILAGGITTVITAPLPVVPQLAAAIAGGTSQVLIRVTDFISHYSFASITTPAVSMPFFLSLIIFLPLLLTLLLKREKVHIHLVLAASILTLLLSAI